MNRLETAQSLQEVFWETARQHYASAFERVGFGHQRELLNKETESLFFQEVRQTVLSQKESLSGISTPQPIEGFPKTTVSVVPSSTLRGLYEEGNLTPLGQAITKVYQVAEVLEINVNILLISGAVQEIMRDKPTGKRHKEGGDNDIVIVVDNPQVAPVLLAEFLNLSLPDYQIMIKEPCWRRGVTLIDVRDSEKKAIAQLSFPEAFYGHGAEVHFIMHAASRRNCPYILLVPDGQELMGAIIDFDPDSKDYERLEFFQRGIKKDHLRRTLKPTVYHWFELAFCLGNQPEAFYHLLHEMQTWAWGNMVPLANYYERGKVNWPKILTDYDQAKVQVIEFLSKEFSTKLAEKVVHRIAQNPRLIVDLNNPQMIQKVREEMTKSQMRTINGDPLLGLIRWLRKGENPSLVPTPLPVYGMGFIDEKGFYPKLDKFLHEGDRLKRLMAKMEACQHATEAGWRTYLNFLYSEANHDFDTLIELLTPNFGPDRLEPALVAAFISPYFKKEASSQIQPDIFKAVVNAIENPELALAG